jgi:hypothetical protein
MIRYRKDELENLDRNSSDMTEVLPGDTDGNNISIVY